MPLSRIWKTVILAGVASVGLGAMATAAPALPQNRDPYFKDARAHLQRALRVKPNTGRARNVILFVGDGMGVTTMTVSRIYAGQKGGGDGVSNKLAYETLPWGAFSRTYSHDSQVTDSAPSAAAMTTGVKSRNGTLGVSAAVPENDCRAGLANQVTTIAQLAERVGMATGAVTTTRVTHATPAATYAHSAGRDWESDADMPDDARAAGCRDIARQLIEMKDGNGLDVVMGGGRDRFLPVTVVDPEYPGKTGKRKDGRNLVEAWLNRDPRGAAYVWDRGGFDALVPARTRRVLGLFEPSHMQYEADRAKDKAGEPSLADMTRKAIDILARNRNGYFLMVEGGRIDHAHHAGNAARALEDTLAFDAAVAAALAKVNTRETLVIVTADHSHVMTMSGYPSRNNPILSTVDASSGKPEMAQDGKPYTTLGYANGPGAQAGKDDDDHDHPRPSRPDVTPEEAMGTDYRQQALVPLPSETHGGEDVPIFATGPWAHLFHGAVDQHYIFHVMTHATGLDRRNPPPKRRR